MAGQRVLGIVLAGAEGKRLAPLTEDRAKSAIPFGGLYRLVDFALSNLANAGIFRICVLTQYKSHSLNRHISTTWRLNNMLGGYVTPVPAQQRLGPHWQTGSADAIYQSLNLIYDDRPDLVAVVGADHVYRMDPAQIIDQHVAVGAGVTVATIPVPLREARSFGVVRAGPRGRRIEAFVEKPADPPSRPGHPDEAYVSMGYYIFDADVLVDALRKDAADDGSGHSIGGDIIPMLARDGAAYAYDFRSNQVPGADVGYWREVRTLDSYFTAHMDLCAVQPAFNLYNNRWPILTSAPPLPPAKFVGGGGQSIDSVVSNGVIVSGGLVCRSVLSPGVRVDTGARVDRAVILHNVRVGRRAVVQDAILDKNVVVHDGATVGVDKEHDRARGFTVSADGITAVAKGRVIMPLPGLRLFAGDEFARPSPGFCEPFCPADQAEQRQGRPDQRAEQPGPPSPSRRRRPVRRQRRPLLRRMPADVDPVRDRRPQRTVRAHLIEPMAD
jgi:glucose-1-phosphate adenylyltransferase